MTNLKFNVVPFERTLSNLFDDFFTEMPSVLKKDVSNTGMKGFAPVNIVEKDNLYQVDIVAPGFEKTDFKINLDNNLLTISAEKKEEVNEETEKNIRKEYHFRSFKRSFTLDEKINQEKIDAKYVNGILKLELGKKEEAKAASKDIVIQ
ncbi:MAG TPA: Hsp20/alpha crystallin family protein [Niabella sp.]|nr:Hsp20/alpha crystallin family protein [Lentimicrobium sp.]MCO5290893.1 Hsp20/alpha crystallin family protein [Chitinophagaceae bacterium]HUN03730.1 Hsp20/alpha crystallin family protein [Niabella sp.]